MFSKINRLPLLLLLLINFSITQANPIGVGNGELPHSVSGGCPVIAAFTGPVGTLQSGQTGVFINASTNANGYSWTIDGVAAGANANLTYTFPTPGIFQIELFATDGTCTDTAFLAVEVGYCPDRSDEQWRFGMGAGLDFTSGSPVVVSNHPMNAFEGGSTVSDQNGNLLFYTNGGTIPTVPLAYPGGIWNRNNQLMPNGTLGINDIGCSSAVQAALSIQHPGNPDQYFVFVNSCIESGNLPGFGYHLVDMSLDNGLGDVALKNQLIYNSGSEYVTAVRKCNGADYWIVSMDLVNPAIRFFELTTAGFNPVAVDSFPFLASQGRYSQMRFSPDGKKMVALHYLFMANPDLTIHLFDFDNATATLTLKEVLEPTYDNVGGMEFSSNSKYLIGGGRTNASIVWRFNQWDVDVPVVGPTLNETTAQVPFGSSPRQLLLAPDGKIYASHPGGIGVSRFNYPNQPQAVLDFNVLDLSPGISINNFVNFPTPGYADPYPHISGNNANCQGSQGSFLVSYDPCGTTGILWEVLGGGQLISFTDSTAEVNFATSGTDTIVVTKVGECSSLSDTMIIQIHSPIIPNLGPDQLLCQGTLNLDAGNGYASYLWVTGDSSQTITVNSPGTYWVEVTDSNGCTGRDSIEALATPGPPMPYLGPDTMICKDTFLLDPGNGYNSYLWSDNTSDSTLVVSQPGTYTVQVTGPCGELGLDTIVFLPCVGIESSVLVSALEVFPNPNNGTFFLEGEFTSRVKNLRMSIVDALGRPIYSKKLNLQGRKLYERVELEDISKGIYILRLEGNMNDSEGEISIDEILIVNP